MTALDWTIGNILLLEIVVAVAVTTVVAWASGATWRDITGIGDTPTVSPPDDDDDDG